MFSSASNFALQAVAGLGNIGFRVYGSGIGSMGIRWGEEFRA